jgi:hypothetical protein
MAVTVGLIFGTVAEQGNDAALRQLLQKPEGKLLPVIFDQCVATVKAPAFIHLATIATAIFPPGNSTFQIPS